MIELVALTTCVDVDVFASTVFKCLDELLRFASNSSSRTTPIETVGQSASATPSLCASGRSNYSPERLEPGLWEVARSLKSQQVRRLKEIFSNRSNFRETIRRREQVIKPTLSLGHSHSGVVQGLAA